MSIQTRLDKIEQHQGAKKPIMVTICWGEDDTGRTFPAPPDSKLTEDTIIRIIQDR